ncbi:MAG: hypothetical protein GOV02_03545 [Candidatus Aenigmarchaeota archaeon]|nr:hypothetical protein [Candidatus Aenigmarchaeota archaeon]
MRKKQTILSDFYACSQLSHCRPHLKGHNAEADEDHIFMMAQVKERPCYEQCQNSCDMYNNRKKLLGFKDKSDEPHPLGEGIPYAN